MKKLWIGGLILLAVVLAIFLIVPRAKVPVDPQLVETAACDPKGRVSRDVIPRAQEEVNWCWAASAQMITEYVDKQQDGKHHPQCEQANTALGKTVCCTDRDSKQDPGVCNKGDWPQFDPDFNAEQTPDLVSLGWEQLTQEICSDRPVAFSWWYGDGAYVGDNDGHMMVARGYAFVAFQDPLQEKHVEFINPCVNQHDPDPNSDSHCVADGGFMSFDLQFADDGTSEGYPPTNPTDIPGGVGHYKHWRDYYNIYRYFVSPP